jgi:peptidyl-prolyl cis-trans isomerase B (cyclophilin B)
LIVSLIVLAALSSGAVARPNGTKTSLASEGETKTNETDPLLEIGNSILIITNWGDITLGLYEVGAPITTSNFLNLTREGFYNGIKFHRIIDDFVIQTGDPNTKDNNPYNDGWGGSAETIPLETSPNITHVDGAVGMARSSEPDSASSQFYICDTPQPHLNGNYSVFAIVTEGMDTVRKIASAETYGNKRPLLKDHPVDDIVMESVSVIYNKTKNNLEDPGGSYPVYKSMEVGMTGIFMLGLFLIGVVVVVYFVRRIIRWRRLRSEDEAMEVEVIEELDEEDLELEEALDDDRWGRRSRHEEDWYEV